jgi:hypothetical protein
MPATRVPPVSRLPHRTPGPAERRRELRSGALALVGLLAVVVGVPAALLLALGNPLPTTAPSREWLTAQITATTVLRVLACALWLAWAHFAVCVVAEWRAALRGRAVADVPLGGGSQLLARRLVAAALLLAGAAALVPSAGTGAPAAPPPAISRIVAQDATAHVLPVDTPAPAVAAVAGPEKVYVVLPPAGRRYDSLWDIAERTLGDPFRYREVFELNRDRVQDDGRKLVDADLIHPGWVLRMPADATGPGVSLPAMAPPPTTPQQPPVPPASVPTPPAQQAPAVTPGQTGSLALPGSQALPGAQALTGSLALPGSQVLLGGGLLAAGLLVALSARRGPYGRPGETRVEQQLRLAAMPGRASLLDRALRGLAADCAARGMALPEVAVAYCDDEHVTLSLAAAAGEPPAPWSAVSGGRGWTVRAADVPQTAPDVAAPYPALAGVALSGRTDVLVDLESAPGLVSLEGDAAVARELAASLIAELTTNLWSDGVRVTAVGFGDDLSALAPGAVTGAGTLDEVLDDLESESRAAAGSLRELGVSGVLAGRLVRDAQRRRPRVVVLSGPPAPEQAERLHALVAEVRTPLAVLCVGTARTARWRFTVDASGVVDLGVLGVRAEARRLPRADYLPLLETLRTADRARSGIAEQVSALTPRAALQEMTGTAAPGPADPATFDARVPGGIAAVTVRLLGPVSVTAPGVVDPAARDLLTEVVVAAALHPEGLHEAVLRAEVWPRGVGDDVLARTLAQVQAWLGSATDGRPRLRVDAAGRYV